MAWWGSAWWCSLGVSHAVAVRWHPGLKSSEDSTVQSHVWSFSWDGQNSWGLPGHFSFSTWLVWASLQHGNLSITGLFTWWLASSRPRVLWYHDRICKASCETDLDVRHLYMLHSIGQRWATGPAQFQGKRTTQGVNTGVLFTEDHLWRPATTFTHMPNDKASLQMRLKIKKVST